jgi:hypothetical protein
MVRFCSLLLLLLPAAALAAKCGEVDKKACDGVCRTLKNQVPRPYLYELCQEGCNTRLNQGKADIRKANKVASAHCQHGGFSHACKSGWFGMHDLFTSCTPDGTFCFADVWTLSFCALTSSDSNPIAQ